MYFLELHKVQLVTNIKINVNARVMQFMNNFKKVFSTYIYNKIISLKNI